MTDAKRTPASTNDDTQQRSAMRSRALLADAVAALSHKAELEEPSKDQCQTAASKPSSSLGDKINNLLQYMDNVLSLIKQESGLSQKGREFVAIMEDSTQRVGELTRDALNQNAAPSASAPESPNSRTSGKAKDGIRDGSDY
jgi:hypothetical protein